MLRKTTCCTLAAAAGLAVLAFHLTRSGAADASDHNDPVRVQATGPRLPGGSTDSCIGDPNGDLADIFAWHTGTPDDPNATLQVILSWRSDPMNVRLDPQVIYGIHIDNDKDGPQLVDDDGKLNPSTGIADPSNIDIFVRYGCSAGTSVEDCLGHQGAPTGKWAHKIEGLPTGDIDDPTLSPQIVPVGPVVALAGGIKVMTNLFDDPFTFDLDGFFNGLSVELGNAAPADPTPENPNRPFGFDNSRDTFAHTNVGALVMEIPLRLLVQTKGKDAGKLYHELHVWGTTREVNGRKLPCEIHASHGGAP